MWINLSKDEISIIQDALRAKGDDSLADRLDQDMTSCFAPENALWAERAGDLMFGTDGEIEAQGDGSFLVSKGDEGAYVMAWVWVSNEDMGVCRECGAVPGTAEYGTVGDGYDGLCPSCADKAEEEKSE